MGHERMSVTRGRALLVALTVLAVILGGVAQGQGLPTATLAGRATNAGQPLPGVSVTVSSPNLQGTRTTVTSINGDYVFTALPPGEYTVRFEISSFEPQTKTIRLAASQQSTLDGQLNLTSVSAEATVIGRTENISTSTQVSTTITSELTNKLPVTRTLLGSVVLSPGVTTNGPAAAVTISGAQSFENLFTVNGVVVTDNIRSTPFNLFIEDAIQETTTSSAGISAEYGRFTGGTVNAITKSGGNAFSGSFRTSLTNDAWTAITPARESRVQDVVPQYEATLGGPIWKDRIWFFGAGRLRNLSGSGQTAFTNIPFETGNDEKRYEGKLTLTPFNNHTVTASYIGIDNQIKGDFQNAAILDLASLNDFGQPQKLFAANYSGVLTSSFFVEGQYSRRQFTFEGAGGKFTDVVRGTVLFDSATGAQYNAPLFCGVCDDETRDNENFLVKGTYFLSTKALGSHNLVFGYDNFAGKVKSNNYQSGSNYFLGGGTIIRGNDIFPVFDSTAYVVYWPITELSKGSDIRTHSVFLNDAIRLNDRLSLNLGVRWDKNAAQDSRGVQTSDDSAFSPRLAATWDVDGRGTLRVSGSYAQYVGALQESVANSASNAGSPAILAYYYDGPEVNTNPNGPLVSREQAINTFFNWWFSIGGPDRPNVPPIVQRLPGVNTQIRGGLNSPNAKEYVLGLTTALGSRGTARVDFVHRDYDDFYSNRRDLTTGTVTNALGERFDLAIVENSNFYDRKYTGLHSQFAYRLGQRLNVGGNWTWSHAIGNFEGETVGSGPTRGTATEYPEYKEARWNSPRGDLAIDQRHRVRLYATYDLPVPSSLGAMSVSLLQSYDTGTPYGAVGGVQSARFVTNPGYVAPPTGVTYFFTARDAFRTDNISRTDVALNYSFRVSRVELFLQPQVINLFNNQGVIAVSTSVLDRTVANGFLRFNPFTETPVRGPQASSNAAATAHWNYGATFGQPRNANDYQAPRQFRMSVGVRF